MVYRVLASLSDEFLIRVSLESDRVRISRARVLSKALDNWQEFLTRRSRNYGIKALTLIDR